MERGSFCHHADAAVCLADIAVKIGVRPRQRDPRKYVGDCPVCQGADKLSVAPGKSDWLIWTCHRRKPGQPGWCDPAEIRTRLLESVGSDHLGGHARFHAAAKRLTRDEQLADALGKLKAIERALHRDDLTPAGLRVEVGAALWTGGRVPDKEDEMPEFLVLAEESGVGRSQRYAEWERRMGGRLRRK